MIVPPVKMRMLNKTTMLGEIKSYNSNKQRKMVEIIMPWGIIFTKTPRPAPMDT